MLNKLKDKALRAALPLLATSAVGRIAINKGIEMISERLDLPIVGEYMSERETWLVTVGEQGAPVQAVLNLSNDALAGLLEELSPYVLNKQEIPREKIFELLSRYLRKQDND